MLACTHPAFDSSMILFQDVIKVLHRSVLAVLLQNTYRVDLPHQIGDEREFVHSSSFTLRRTSSAAASTSRDRPTPESKFSPSIP